MAATTPRTETSGSPQPRPGRRRDEPMTAWRTIKLILKPVASLKLTVMLFVLLTILIFVGTLAQANESMWDAVHRYFYSFAVLINFNTLFPKSFFPGMPHLPDSLFGVPIGIPFPGGALLGGLLFINLLAAHLVRFSTQARGVRLIGGLLVMLLGTLATLLVVFSGSNADGLQGIPKFVEWWGWVSLWYGLKFGLLPICLLGSIAGAVATYTSGRRIESYLLMGISALLLLGVIALWAVFRDARLDDSALRIMWQLIQGALVGLVLLLGALLAFKQRGGMVVLHLGVGLLMVGMFWVAFFAVEERISIAEGQSSSEAIDIREVELAVIDHSPQDHDKVVAVPQSRLSRTQVLSNEDLPFDVQLEQYFPNSKVVKVSPDEKTPATAGTGLRAKPVNLRVGAGADAGGEVDIASAYVRLFHKGTDKPIGTYLVSQELLQPEHVTVDGKTYDLKLRFKTTPKPYTIYLLDVSKDDYMGTDTPMNYSSEIRLVDNRYGVDREHTIWMNNPLRYAGETFYQSGYDQRGGMEFTTLQVVTNSGWMMPYVACMITAIGMLAHFWIVLVRFLKRLVSEQSIARDDEEDDNGRIADEDRVQPARRPRKPGQGRRKRRQSVAPAESGSLTLTSILLPAVVVLLACGWLAYASIKPRYKGMDLYAAGELPIMYQGRLKPLDTLARNTLRIISNYETFSDEDGNTQPAIRWLLDVISGSPAARKHKVFRIDNHQVLSTLGLKRREGFRYSVEEIQKNLDKFQKNVAEARRIKQERPADFDTYEKKLLETEKRLGAYVTLVGAFFPPDLPPLPTAGEFEKDRQAAFEKVAAFQQARAMATQRIEAANPPLVIPNPKPGEDWEPYSVAYTDAFIARVLGQEPDEYTVAWTRILDDYRKGNTQDFNGQVSAYRQLLASNPPEQLAMDGPWYDSPLRPVTDFEAYFNHFSPFIVCCVLYVVAFVLTMVGIPCLLFKWHKPFFRAAFFLILLTFVVHTLALLARMYISGRPPVTNLYSSAVFIGWAAVGAGLVIELVFRLGVGNIIAAVMGMATMLIAYLLAGDGDTMIVMQAVLDTQFWLATHVVSITLGYSATFVAGLVGIFTILVAVVLTILRRTRAIGPNDGEFIERILHKITFGVVCFAILFSFVGTVLGGLWADDSWGRFWGWDPKENGAAMIVIWNAVLLHARWDRMVGARGFAVLAVIGNIVTAWSWFGVNELGVGLHSYGFTEGVLLALFLFAGSQVLLIGLGLLTTKPGQRLLDRIFSRADAATVNADIVEGTAT